MRILYIGDQGGTSQHRTQAMRRLGHQVRVLDPRTLIPDRLWLHHWNFKTGALFTAQLVEHRILVATATDEYDLVWVGGGALVSRSLADGLRQRFKRIVNYNNDDPFGTRDGLAWRQYLSAVPVYDVLAVLREVNVAEAKRAGAKNVLRVFMSADEIEHAPRELTEAERARWASDVIFVGTWMPERSPFMLHLLRKGVPLAIYGNRWDKAPEWQDLRPAWRGAGLPKADDYVKAIQCARICLGLVSKENRDLHTRRSIEIPYIGSLLLCERTSEHAALYRENEEAVFWSDADECADKCHWLLSDEGKRRQIAARGRLRCLENGLFNEKIVQQVIDAAMTVRP